MLRSGVAKAREAPLRQPVSDRFQHPADQHPSFKTQVTLHQIVSLCVEPAAKPHERTAIASDCWPALIRTALEHGVAPLMHLRAREHRVPESARIELARIYRANLARNLVLDRQREILEAQLQKDGVKVVALKGPQLSESLYGDLGARQVADVDLLIRPGDLPTADRIFALLGYARSAPEGIARLQNCRDVLYAKELGNGTHIFVDLHLLLRPYGSRDALVERIWREGMSRENLLLYLCLNLMTHRFVRLQPYMDLVAFLQKEETRLDWNRVVQAAQKLEWTPGVFYALTFAAQFENTRAPEWVFRALRPGRLQRLWIEAILGGDAYSALERNARLNGPYGTLALLACEKGFARKLQLAGSILFPPGPALRQMDAPPRELALPLHYLERLARKTTQLARRLAPPKSTP